MNGEWGREEGRYRKEKHIGDSMRAKTRPKATIQTKIRRSMHIFRMMVFWPELFLLPNMFTIKHLHVLL